MSSCWESIVSVAREIDGAFANGTPPEPVLVMQLARAVVDFQQQLAGPKVIIKTRPIQYATDSSSVACRATGALGGALHAVTARDRDR